MMDEVSFFFLPSDFADVESLGRASSDEENQESDGEEQKAEVTNMDEALRTVTAEHSHEDFLQQNFETLAERSSVGREPAVLLSPFSVCLFF